MKFLRKPYVYAIVFAILTSGMLIKGIINISGRYTQYDMVYWILGVIFLFEAIVVQKLQHI